MTVSSNAEKDDTIVTPEIPTGAADITDLFVSAIKTKNNKSVNRRAEFTVRLFFCRNNKLDGYISVIFVMNFSKKFKIRLFKYKNLWYNKKIMG